MARGNTKKPQSIGGDRRAGAASLAGGSIGEGGQRRQTDSSTGKSIIYEGRSKVATSTTKNARKSQWARQRRQRGRQERGYRSPAVEGKLPLVAASVIWLELNPRLCDGDSSDIGKNEDDGDGKSGEWKCRWQRRWWA